MEINTGASVSLISESVLKALLPQLSIKRYTLNLKANTGESIPAKGSVIVDVTYGSLSGLLWIARDCVSWVVIGCHVSIWTRGRSVVNPQDRLNIRLCSLISVVSSPLTTSLIPPWVPLEVPDQVGKELDRMLSPGLDRDLKDLVKACVECKSVLSTLSSVETIR